MCNGAGWREAFVLLMRLEGIFNPLPGNGPLTKTQRRLAKVRLAVLWELAET